MQPTQQIKILIHKLVEYPFFFADIPGAVNQFNRTKGVINRGDGTGFLSVGSKANNVYMKRR